MNKLDPKQVISEHWETPVIDSQFLWLYRQLYTSNNNYFFFHKDSDGPEDSIYVLTIRGGETFKISDESDSTYRINRLLENAPEYHTKWPKTFKVWNSPFALEACLRLGITEKEYDEMEKFQYVVLTQDETIEFVTSDVPVWEIYEGVAHDDLVIQHLKKDS
jgi:hypothetical protein